MGKLEDFNIRISIRNNHLLARRRELNMSQPDLAEAANVPVHAYRRYECCQRDPIDKKGNWRDDALALSAFHGVSVEELWPDVVRRVRTHAIERDVSGEDLLMLSGGPPEQDPQKLLMDKELIDTTNEILDTLPKIQADIIRARFHGDMTLEEVGEIVGKSKEQVRQLEAKALRALRHPTRSKYLDAAAHGRSDRFIDKDEHLEAMREASAEWQSRHERLSAFHHANKSKNP